MNDKSTAILEALRTKFPGQRQFTMKIIEETATSLGISNRNAFKAFANEETRIRFGVYDLTRYFDPSSSAAVFTAPVAMPTAPTMTGSVSSVVNDSTYIPAKDPTFVSWGAYDDIRAIVSARSFYPVYISGLSGNGKTMMVEQACATLGREYIRVQISPETDEDDLIGGFRLLDGETVFAKGPVIKAMERGALLLIDELDRGTNKIMCLQGILEGKPIMIKKTGEVIRPAPGFNIIATANTKGKGSEDGRFVAAQIIDEAFLERFVCTIEQPYPTLDTEKKIVARHMTKYGVQDPEFTDKLVIWSSVIRKSFEEDGIDELVSTRRLCHIAHTYSIFKDRMKAIKLCISRFDADTKEAFLDLYTKVDSSVQNEAAAKADESKGSAALDKNEPPF
jgi:hypothetical protein